MPLAVDETLNSIKQPNKQKKTKKTLNFGIMSHEITNTEMGSGSILLNHEPQNGFHGSEKRNTSLSYHMTPNRPNEDKT